MFVEEKQVKVQMDVFVLLCTSFLNVAKVVGCNCAYFNMPLKKISTLLPLLLKI